MNHNNLLSVVVFFSCFFVRFCAHDLRYQNYVNLKHCIDLVYLCIFYIFRLGHVRSLHNGMLILLILDLFCPHAEDTNLCDG